MVFTRKEILDAAAEGYGDEIIIAMYDDQGNEVESANEIAWGDSLALFVVREIISLTQPEGNGEETLADLRTAFERASEELDRVYSQMRINVIEKRAKEAR